MRKEKEMELMMQKALASEIAPNGRKNVLLIWQIILDAEKR